MHSGGMAQTGLWMPPKGTQNQTTHNAAVPAGWKAGGRAGAAEFRGVPNTGGTENHSPAVSRSVSQSHTLHCRQA